MKKGGTGGSHTQTGAAFEKQTDLVRKLTDAGYDISGFAILSKGIEVGRVARHTNFSKQILRPFGVEWKDYISKELRPDEAVLSHKAKLITIVEKKYQQGEGSVDEKIQTCHFKMRQYRRLATPMGCRIKFIYQFEKDGWFTKPRYKDVLEYVKEVGATYFYGEVPLSEFELG